MTENAPPGPEADDLGLTAEEWLDLQYAYNYGTFEPAPGTVEAEAFRQMDNYARREVERAAGRADETRRASRPAAHRRPDRNQRPGAAPAAVKPGNTPDGRPSRSAPVSARPPAIT